MYLRGLQSQSRTLLVGLSFYRVVVARSTPFSSVAPRPDEKRSIDAACSPVQHQQQHGQQKQQPRRSIRPFTVLALCVPLGYALSWSSNRQDGNTTSASADGFVKYTLVGKENISSTSSIFALKPATSSHLPTGDPRLERAIQSVQFKQPQLQIARNYTLLPRGPDDEPEELKFLIRKELDGEMSGYLHRLAVGSEIELRGPVVDYILPEKVDSIVFLAGGTGIAPAMQVAEALKGEARVHILWASRRRGDCLGGVSDTMKSHCWAWDLGLGRWLNTTIFGRAHGTGEDVHASEKSYIVSRLNDIKHLSSRTTAHTPAPLVDYFVDDESTFINPDQIRRLLESDRTVDMGNGGRILLVSGPDGFVAYWAGAKQWLNGREVQGPLGGVLSTLKLGDWEVVKL